MLVIEALGGFRCKGFGQRPLRVPSAQIRNLAAGRAEGGPGSSGRGAETRPHARGSCKLPLGDSDALATLGAGELAQWSDEDCTRKRIARQRLSSCGKQRLLASRLGISGLR